MATFFNGNYLNSFQNNTGAILDTKKTRNTTVTTYNSRYPEFTKEEYEKLERMVDEKGLTGYAKQQEMDELYQYYLPQVQNQHKLSERAADLNKQAAQVNNMDGVGKKIANNDLKISKLAQAAKQAFPNDISADANDVDVINAMVNNLENGDELFANYINKGDDTILYKSGIKKETGWQKAGDFAVGVLQSPGKRGYNMIGQWMDKLGKAAADKLEGSDLQKRVQEKAIEAFGEDEVRAFQEQTKRELEEGTAFNGREQTDIRTPLLGSQYRANNGWTKAGEVVGDIGTAVAMSAPLGSALAPAMATQGVGNAALLGAIEGGLDTLAAQYGSQGNLNVTPTQAILGVGGGALGGVLTNKLSQIGNNVDDVAKNTEITTKIADKTDDANRVAGRIGQGDIDDQAKVVEGVKSITKRSGEKGITDIKKYSELKDAIKATEKQIINQEDDLLRQFPEKITDWTTTETVRGLGDQVDDITRDYLDDGIELLKKYNKNDPVAMKELEMLQNTKNTEGLTRLEAKELARKLGAKLSKKFYNSNDELRNSMSAESYEQIRRGIQNAVRDRLPDNALKNLDVEYSNLKAFEGLTDDMTEKVNTLTQKLKEVGPIEKLGKKVGDAINRVTGKGIKGVVEKFLPSNMGNKINNSIDMEIELSKNLSKLVDLNKAIDTLNTTLNNPASKSAINTALRNFANSISELQINLTPAITSTTTIGYNTLEK